MKANRIYVHADALAYSNLKIELVLAYIRLHPFKLLLVLWWFFSKQLNQNIFIDSRLSSYQLPFSDEIIFSLQKEKVNKKELILVSHYSNYINQIILDQTQLFEHCLHIDKNSSQGWVSQENNFEPFVYVGKSIPFKILQNNHAEVFLSNSTREEENQVRAMQKNYQILTQGRQKSLPEILASALRIHQWSKNTFIFIPLLAAHIANPTEWFKAIFAFFAFSFAASAVYVINDLLDLESDRKSNEKKHRAFASGKCSLENGLLLIPALLLSSGFVLLFLPLAFSKVLAIYFIITVLYSFGLKKKVLIDTIILAVLYTMRLLAGGAVADIEISHWLLSLSLFFFFSLAQLKRYAELGKLTEEKNKIAGRGYRADDKILVMTLGVSSSLLSVLIFVLYINSEKVTQLYVHPDRLWLFSPCLMYWISRLWFKAHHGEVNEDPVIFAIKDIGSYILVLLMLGIVYSAI